ncbi:hypothetical protein [Methylobacterium sp. E-046]|uniref:hypothetical protein n=1 Tax=Methylobacterium sp. E-046 TaxID=2836576 RepID=UPI001FB94CCE|nr:hypothetical protein [Methylobacterium sp. E-046]MCJ2098950.1 hypothetical protein [Methylobacterium sp. E-046]
MSAFDEQWSAALQRLDAFFGEDFLLEPLAVPTVNGRPDVNARAVTDDTRPPVQFRATYRDIGSTQNAKGRAMADNTTRKIAADGPHLRLTPLANGFPGLQANDRVTRLKTGERFRAGVPLSRGRAGLQVPLTPITR